LLRNLKKLKPDRSAGDDIAKKVALNGDEWGKLLKKARGPTRGYRVNDDDENDSIETLKNAPTCFDLFRSSSGSS
jgi:hypothetical protein